MATWKLQMSKNCEQQWNSLRFHTKWKPHRTASFLEGQQLLIWSIHPLHFIESDGSLARSQQPATRWTLSTSPSISLLVIYCSEISVPTSAFSFTLEVCDWRYHHTTLGPLNFKEPVLYDVLLSSTVCFTHCSIPTELSFESLFSLRKSVLPPITKPELLKGFSWNLILENFPTTFQHIPLVEVTRQYQTPCKKIYTCCCM